MKEELDKEVVDNEKYVHHEAVFFDNVLQVTFGETKHDHWVEAICFCLVTDVHCSPDRLSQWHKSDMREDVNDKEKTEKGATWGKSQNDDVDLVEDS